MTHRIFRAFAGTAFRALLSIVLPWITASQLSAQPVDQRPTGSERQLIDGVAAVVGDEIILVSDVLQNAILLARQSQGTDPLDPEVQREVLDALINEKLVLVRAGEDSITVTDEEISRGVDYRLQVIEQQLGSRERIEQAYGMSIEQIRREARDIIRQQLILDKVRQRRFADVKPSERDLQEFYAAYRDSLPAVPEQFELQHIYMSLKPSETGRQKTIALAERIIDSLKNGGDFADFAKRWSKDPGSAANGGDLGLVEEGRFVKEYEEAAADLGINEISDPVETQFGIHIIQVLDRKGTGTRSRHILLKTEASEMERDSIRAALKDLRRRAMNGEDFADLAREYSQDEETRALGGSLGKRTADQLPANLKEAVPTMEEGAITEPLATTLSPTESGYHIVRLARRIPEHVLDPSEDRERLVQLATRYKQNKEYTKWIEELRKEIYWEIKIDI